MSFDFSGYVLRPIRTAPSNASTSGEPESGVVRGVSPIPTAYALDRTTPAPFNQPDLVEVWADQYRAAILLSDEEQTTEYLLWAENSSQLGLVEDPAWWQQDGTGSLTQGTLTVTDASPEPIPDGEPTPEGYGEFDDGTDTVIVTDDGGRSISSITHLVVARGDVDDYDDRGWVNDDDPSLGRSGFNPYLVLEIASADQDPVAGTVTLTDAQLTSLGGGLSIERGDQIITPRYFVAASRFWWTKNDATTTRFGWDASVQRWRPFKGSSVVEVGLLRPGTQVYQLDPIPEGLVVRSTLPGDPSTPDAYATIRLGSNPGAGSTPAVIKVKFDEEVEDGSYNFSNEDVDGVIGATNGTLIFNPDFIEDFAGQTIWYSPREFVEGATGVVAPMLDARASSLPVYLAPVPGILEHPFISFGSRSYLSPIVVETEADLDLASPSPGQVVVAISTGRLKFNQTDIARADPDSDLFDKEFLGESIVYDGVALNGSAQPTRTPVALVDSGGNPADVSATVDLFVPDAVNLPGLGVSGILDVPDGTGAVPDLVGTDASVRPGGDVLGDPATGRIRSVSDGVGDTILFSRRGQVGELIVVDTDEEFPDFPWNIDGGTAYIAREKVGVGSPVMLSSGDLRTFGGDRLYFLQSTVTPAHFTTTARVVSTRRDFFRLTDDDRLIFSIDATPYLWEASTLVDPSRTLYTAQEVADSIDAVISGTGQARTLGGHIVLEGDNDVEIGFGYEGARDLSGSSALGLLPGWRAVDGQDNWLPDSGSAVGLKRSPVNPERVDPLADYKATSRFVDLIVQGDVQPIPFVFFDRPPLRDVAGYDRDVFFKIVSVIRQGGQVQIINRFLENYEDVEYRFDEDKFAWVDRARLTSLVTQATNVLNLGQPLAIPESLLGAPGVGGGLFVSEDGGALVELTQGDDYLLEQEGTTGTALLTNRIGSVEATGSRGQFSQGSSTFTDTSVDFSNLGVEPGYRLKVLSGPGEGSYIIGSVGTTTLTIERPSEFPADSGGLTPWEIYEGETAEVFDPAIVADVSFTLFDHLPEEPFVVSLLTRLGDASTGLFVADMAEAVEKGRSISLRYGLDHPEDDGSNVGALIPLEQTVLGQIADGLVVPTDRLASGSFQLFISGTAFSPTGVSSFTADPTEIEYLLADVPSMDQVAGQLKFPADILSDYDSSQVVYRETFQPASDLDGLSAEYNPNTGLIGLSEEAADLDVDVWFVQEMIVEDREDISVSPILGSFGFRTPVQTGQVVEVTYYRADLEGRRLGDPVTEFLPLFVENEVAQRVDSRTYRYNVGGVHILDDRIDPIVRAGVLQQNFGGTNQAKFVVDPDGSGRVEFLYDLPEDTVVKLTYAILDALGGERTYDASNRPLYRPPFFIEADKTVVGLRSDRRDDFIEGQMLRVGGACFYIKKVNYFPARIEEIPPTTPLGQPTFRTVGDVTGLVLFPSYDREVGSRSPANDVPAFITDRPIALEVDPDSDTAVTPADSRAGFWSTLDLEDHPFEPVNRNQNTIIFLGQPDYMVEGHILEINGYPFTIAQVEVTPDGTRTRLTLTYTFPTGFAVNESTTVRLSVRPVYPPEPSDFLSVGGVLREEPFELVLFGEVDSDGQELPGRTLVQGVDYVIDFDNGLIRFLGASQEPLQPNQSLYFSYTKLTLLEPFNVEGQTLFPRFRADYLYVTTPSTANGLLGALVQGTYTYSNPDTYYFRIAPLSLYMGEVAQQAAEDIASRQPAGGALVSQPGATPENFERGNLGLLAQRRDLLDRDRASRVFLDFYNTTINAFEQILETISGIFIGDRDGKFRFFVGRGKEYPPPGYEDPITGYLNPRNLFAEVFDAEDPSQRVIFLEKDNVVVPSTATITDGRITGRFPDADTLEALIDKQQDLIQNDIDDVVLVRLDVSRVRSGAIAGFYELRARGIFARMVDPHALSRLFPTQTRAFFVSYPGIGSDLDGGLVGRYSYGTTFNNQTGSTFRKTIGTLSNPVLGDITGVRDAVLTKRRSRARIWAYSETGFPELDAALTVAGASTFGSNPRPALIATPGLLRDFPLDPETGAPDISRFISEGGDVIDLVTGDPELANPGFSVGDQLGWGFPDGTFRAAYSNTGLSVFGLSTLGGLFVGEVLLGCVITFARDGGSTITSADDVLVATGRDSGDPAQGVLEQGDTVYVVPSSGITSALPDPPDLDTMALLTQGNDTYRVGFDVGIRTDGRVVDLSMPSRQDPSFLAIKEYIGQNTPAPTSTLEGDVDFIYNGQNPLEIPALSGDIRDDDGDYQIPYLTTSNTELDRFSEASAGVALVVTTTDPSGNYVYPDEVVGDDGEIRTDYQAGFGNGTYKEPATLLTREDVQPVANGNTGEGLGDVEQFDLLILEVDNPGDPDQGYRGILTVGDVLTQQTSVSPADYSSWLEPPRFVTPTTPRTSKASLTGSPVRYVFGNAFVFTNTPGSYPADPQATPPAGVEVIEDTTGPNVVTTLEFDSIGQIALNDGLAVGPPAGNLNDIWDSAGAKANNKITFELISRDDPNISISPGPLPISPGIVLYRITIQGLTVTTEDYTGATATTAITDVVFGDGPSGTAANNKQVVVTSATPWFDYQGATPGDQAAWYLPHEEPVVGVKESIYGWEFALSVDTWNVGPASSGKGESTTAWIDTDRLTFHEVIDMRRVKERGYQHPLSGLSLESLLTVHEVTLGVAGGTASIVTRDNNGPAVTPFTFAPRSIVATDPGSYQHNDAGGTWSPSVLPDTPEDGAIRVMAFEGYGNTTISDTGVRFTAIPSSIGMEGEPTICEGFGVTESDFNTSVNNSIMYDDRITDISVTSGAVPNVESGDILVVKESPDATHKATTKAGTYLVRHAVGTGGVFEPFDLETSAGSDVGFSPFTFPTFVSYDTGANELVISDMFSYDGLPVLSTIPSGFEATGRIFIVRDVEALAGGDIEGVISAAYSSADDTTNTFTITPGSFQYADGSALTEAEFDRLSTEGAPPEGYAISGMVWFPIRMGGTDPGLPDNNVVGWDDDSGSNPYGFRWFSLIAPSSFPAASVEFDGTTEIGKTSGAGIQIIVEDGAVASSASFVSPVETIVYPSVPYRLYLGDLTTASWNAIYDPECLLPGTTLALRRESTGDPGFRAQAGIFLEPSFVRSVFDLSPSVDAHVVDDDHVVSLGDLGMRNVENLIGLTATGTPDVASVPTVPEEVVFEVRRIRRFHDVQGFVGRNLTPLKYAYQIRRGRITGYTHQVGGTQQAELVASGFTMTYNADVATAPKAPDVWNTGEGHNGTNLGGFLDEDVGIFPGDLVRVIDEEGEVIDEVEIASLSNGTTLRLAEPGLTALDPADYTTDGGYRFEVYLRRAPVPHEQTVEQLLDLMTFQKVHQTFADESTLQGGYVPQINSGETYQEVANRLYDDSLAPGQTFSILGVRPGDIVIVDPAGTMFRDDPLPTAKEKGQRPFGDKGVEPRTGDVGVTGEDVYEPGGPTALDDNRGFYRIVEVVDDPTPHLVVEGVSDYTGTIDSDVIFPEFGPQDDLGYTIYPTIHDSDLNSATYVDTGTPDGREGQMDLRPTRLPDGTTNSYQDYSDPVGDPGEAYSLRPFSYRVIRPSTLFSDAAIDLILSTRERMLSLIELFGSSVDGDKFGSYFIFQRDRHAHDVGDPVDPLDGLGVFSNSLLATLIGRMDVAPFANTEDALSILDRRFWILDRRLDQLAPLSTFSAQTAGGLTPYTAYTAGGSAVRPVLPDRVDIFLDVEDRFRSFRQTWLAYRTNRILGTLATIERFEDRLPDLQAEEKRLIQIQQNTEEGE